MGVFGVQMSILVSKMVLGGGVQVHVFGVQSEFFCIQAGFFGSQVSTLGSQVFFVAHLSVFPLFSSKFPRMIHPSEFLYFPLALNPYFPQVTSVPGAPGGDERTRSRSGQKSHLGGSQRFNHVGPRAGEDVTNLPNSLSPLFWAG